MREYPTASPCPARRPGNETGETTSETSRRDGDLSAAAHARAARARAGAGPPRADGPLPRRRPRLPVVPRQSAAAAPRLRDGLPVRLRPARGRPALRPLPLPGRSRLGLRVGGVERRGRDLPRERAAPPED